MYTVGRNFSWGSQVKAALGRSMCFCKRKVDFLLEPVEKNLAAKEKKNINCRSGTLQKVEKGWGKKDRGGKELVKRRRSKREKGKKRIQRLKRCAWEGRGRGRGKKRRSRPRTEISEKASTTLDFRFRIEKRPH